MEGQEYYKFFNLKKVADEIGMDSGKVYNNFRGLYSSLNPKDCNNMVKVLRPAIIELFKRLGYTVTITKNETQDVIQSR